MINKQIELLAPAGSMEALKAAVLNGGDAVYLGGYKFGARHYASNFSIEELKEAIEFCHINDVRVYVTTNTLIHNRELPEFLDYMYTLYELDVDGVIVQDIGVLDILNKYIPGMERHSSTQLTIHNKAGVELLKELGVCRAVMAREMSIDEIADIKSKTDMELEVFVHGALCMCYSGQCLMSSMIGGRSGNRGKCAQPCRLKYTLVGLEGNKGLNEETYLLSPKDLNTIDYVDKLIEAKVDSLKLEGRMKKPEYVATVVGQYRDAIDSYLNRGKFSSKEANANLEQIFNRGFTKGHLFKDSTLVDFKKPGNRGRYIGDIIGFNTRKKRLTIKLVSRLAIGDGIELKTGSDEEKSQGLSVKDMYIKDKPVNNAQEGDIVEIPYKYTLVKGQVFKTLDQNLLESARTTYQRISSNIPLYAQVTAMLGDTLNVYLWDDDGNSISVQGEYIIEQARNKALDEDRLRTQISKVGDTQYSMIEVGITLDDNIAMPIGEINRVRREAISQLNTMRANKNKRDTIDRRPLILEKAKGKKGLELICSVDSMYALKAVLQAGVDKVYYKDFYTLKNAIALGIQSGVRVIPSLSRISEDMENDKLIKTLQGLDIEEAQAGNLGQLKLLRDAGIKSYTDYGVNVFNSPTANALGKLGASRVTLSPELNRSEIRDVASKTNTPLELLGYGRIEMMITKYCPKKEVTGCKNCTDKDKQYAYGLQDRKKVIFPIKMDDKCRTIIYNSKCNVLIDSILEIHENNINFLRLQFTNESKDEIIYVVNTYKRCLDNIDNPKKLKEIANELIDMYKNNDNYTKGHYLRGVD